ncbi:hypothetical protein REPUB_Repub03eG0269700 [Reevesia pubescens]
MDMSRRPAATKSVLVTLSDLVKGEKRIVLKVQGEKEADEFCYWMGRETPLRNLMIDYTERIGVAFNFVRFHIYDGSPIIPDFTPDTYQMEDGDIITVIEWDGFRVMGATQSTLITLPLVDGEKPIVLKVQWPGKDDIQFYLIGRNTPLDNLIHDYADRIFELNEHIILFYKGYKIEPMKTAGDLGLEDGDIINVRCPLSQHFFCFSSVSQ